MKIKKYIPIFFIFVNEIGSYLTNPYQSKTYETQTFTWEVLSEDRLTF